MVSFLDQLEGADRAQGESSSATTRKSPPLRSPHLLQLLSAVQVQRMGIYLHATATCLQARWCAC